MFENKYPLNIPFDYSCLTNIIIKDNYFENLKINGLKSNYLGNCHSTHFINLFSTFGYTPFNAYQLWEKWGGEWLPIITFLLYLKEYDLIGLTSGQIYVKEIDVLQLKFGPQPPPLPPIDIGQRVDFIEASIKFLEEQTSILPSLTDKEALYNSIKELYTEGDIEVVTLINNKLLEYVKNSDLTDIVANLTNKINTKQDSLIAGNNITLLGDNTISATTDYLNYSTSEVLAGGTYEGKPLYKITFTSPCPNNSTINSTIPFNYTKIAKLEFLGKGTNDYIVLPHVDLNVFLSSYITENSLFIKSNFDATQYTLYVTAYYTK